MAFFTVGETYMVMCKYW